MQTASLGSLVGNDESAERFLGSWWGAPDDRLGGQGVAVFVTPVTTRQVQVSWRIELDVGGECEAESGVAANYLHGQMPAGVCCGSRQQDFQHRLARHGAGDVNAVRQVRREFKMKITAVLFQHRKRKLQRIVKQRDQLLCSAPFRNNGFAE